MSIIVNSHGFKVHVSKFIIELVELPSLYSVFVFEMSQVKGAYYRGSGEKPFNQMLCFIRINHNI